MDIRNKITQERYNDSGAKVYILNRVKGGPKDGLMILHLVLGKEFSALVLEHMFEAMRDRF